MFRATNIVKNNDRKKYVYSSYGITFDGKGEWSFGNDFTRNVIILGVDNNSSSHTENLKNDFFNFLLLVLMKDLVHQKKN